MTLTRKSRARAPDVLGLAPVSDALNGLLLFLGVEALRPKAINGALFIVCDANMRKCGRSLWLPL